MGDTLNDLTGQRFGKWLIIGRAPNRGRSVMWFGKCDCGSIKTVAGTSLKTGTSTSCGCNLLNRKPRSHGLSKHPLYKVWQRMKGCTTSKTHQDYKHYGARGIAVCSEWLSNFSNFYEWAISSGYERGLTIERVDVNGNYEPDNCTWIPRSEQPKNTRRTNRGVSP